VAFGIASWRGRGLGLERRPVCSRHKGEASGVLYRGGRAEKPPVRNRPPDPDFAEWILAESPEGSGLARCFPWSIPKRGGPTPCIPSAPWCRPLAERPAWWLVRRKKLVDEGGKRVRKPVKLFAGAHDLRRAFCSRWARKVMPAVLQRLARHAHISTTMAYYASLSADEIGADLWPTTGN